MVVRVRVRLRLPACLPAWVCLGCLFLLHHFYHLLQCPLFFSLHLPFHQYSSCLCVYHVSYYSSCGGGDGGGRYCAVLVFVVETGDVVCGDRSSDGVSRGE
ncbi:hypothetical protein E2C01_013334 [Portunus trituberculatus]|uniref:Uncharacterized protein n=1 Tax=Portunus trituberculatus TaxID=210409 RepID=A0A5B7DFX3_PORTR|nr:hypothetical protein [Portunus trituberculatus]